MKYFNCVLKFAMGFSEATRFGSLQRMKMSRFGSITEDVRWRYSGDLRNSLLVSVDKKIELHAVRLFGSENNEYSVTLTVTDSNGVSLATKTGKFMSQLVQSERGDYHGFDVAFEPPVDLQAGTQYSLEASISGPPSWYGQLGLTPVKHAGVNFFFTNTAEAEVGYDTTVRLGQFPQLVFAVK